MAASMILRIKLGPFVSFEVEGENCEEICQSLKGFEKLNERVDGMCSDRLDARGGLAWRWLNKVVRHAAGTSDLGLGHWAHGCRGRLVDRGDCTDCSLARMCATRRRKVLTPVKATVLSGAALAGTAASRCPRCRTLPGPWPAFSASAACSSSA